MLEPFLADGRKLRRRNRVGVSLTYMDVFVDELLTKERVCGTSLWKMPKREVLEDLDVLDVRVSALGDIEDLLDEDGEVEVVGSRRGSPAEERGGIERGWEEGSESGEERDRMDVDEPEENGTK